MAIPLATALLCACTQLEHDRPAEQLSYGAFHELRIYLPHPPAQHLALLLSGDGGWGAPLHEIAARLSSEGTLVAGIDVRDLFARYEHDAQHCASPAEDLQQLAHYLQQRYALPSARPVLIGHSAGATLAYIALAQSAPGTFAGALTLSFCADLDLVKPLCATPAPGSVRRSQGIRLLPAASALPGPWFALHGLDDSECPAPEAQNFAATIPGTHFIGLPGITHRYHHIGRWWPMFDGAWRQLIAAAPGRAAP
ncbi:MAG TPA: AcvB/VirJ family lysyl-phosphatidylglycerol hydrolase [Steroidobacteraceae bacterium]|nr:AcvB/VirJ family lysyl-phosphatidylglycerol hydrolase [Steroidobacteraceae bacterium]